MAESLAVAEFFIAGFRSLVQHRKRVSIFCLVPEDSAKVFRFPLEEIFSGNKELFKGLWIYQSDYSWEKHPVIHLHLSK
ncbi:MAG TPA: hypothetical protein PKK94_02165, partial [Leptospiraceae bacterium]|nr:hypothetical protein [Leptospiraceae bacterium]